MSVCPSALFKFSLVFSRAAPICPNKICHQIVGLTTDTSRSPGPPRDRSSRLAVPRPADEPRPGGVWPSRLPAVRRTLRGPKSKSHIEKSGKNNIKILKIKDEGKTGRDPT